LNISFRKTLPLAAVLGVLVGLFGAVFYEVWHRLQDLIWEHLPNPMHRIWVSAAIGLVIGLIIMKLWDPGTMSDLIHHFHERGKLPSEDNRPIIPISLVGLVGGSSAGPEGVLTQVCGSMGAWVAEKFGQPGLTRVLTQAGMGAGFGAFLGAPVGGAILWLEMPHKKGLEYFEALVPTITTSLVGYLVMAELLHVNLTPVWHLTAYTPSTVRDLAIAAGLGLAAGGAALLYAWIFRSVGAAFGALRAPIWVKTTLAGLGIGLLGAFFPLTYFYGRVEINELIAGSFPFWLLLTMLVAKMLAASITIKGHWQGGLIIPHMFMGAALGKLVAMAIPGVDPTLAMLTGMAAFNAAATHTPLASALIVVALTGSGAVIPIFLASLAGFFIGQRVDLIGGKQHRTDWGFLPVAASEGNSFPDGTNPATGPV
jgi:H+/Cl- antiporter ClcA